MWCGVTCDATPNNSFHLSTRIKMSESEKRFTMYIYSKNIQVNWHMSNEMKWKRNVWLKIEYISGLIKILNNSVGNKREKKTAKARQQKQTNVKKFEAAKEKKKEKWVISLSSHWTQNQVLLFMQYFCLPLALSLSWKSLTALQWAEIERIQMEAPTQTIDSS